MRMVKDELELTADEGSFPCKRRKIMKSFDSAAVKGYTKTNFQRKSLEMYAATVIFRVLTRSQHTETGRSASAHDDTKRKTGEDAVL